MLQCVRERIAAAMLAQESGVGGDHVRRADLAALYKYEAILMERQSRETMGGSQGFFITQYSRGPYGGIR